MKIEQIIIPAGLLAAAVAVWVYLKGGNAGVATQVSYPNATAGGLPQYQSPGIAYNFGTRQAAPSPSLTLGPPPAIPPTPTYQKYNYSPINIFGLTPEAAAKVVLPSSSMTGHPSDCCCCNPCAGNQPVFQDGNQSTGVVANRKEQALATSPVMLQGLTNNLATSPATDAELAWATVAKLHSNAFMYSGTGFGQVGQ